MTVVFDRDWRATACRELSTLPICCAYFDPNGALGLDTVLNQNRQLAKPLILFSLYLNLEIQKPSNAQRDQTIRIRYTEGETISDLARTYRLSAQRIFQIVHHN